MLGLISGRVPLDFKSENGILALNSEVRFSQFLKKVTFIAWYGEGNFCVRKVMNLPFLCTIVGSFRVHELYE